MPRVVIWFSEIFDASIILQKNKTELKKKSFSHVKKFYSVNLGPLTFTAVHKEHAWELFS